jgi:hypothetical protein
MASRKPQLLSVGIGTSFRSPWWRRGRGLTLEVSGPQRHDARPRPQKMYSVPVAGAWWHAAVGPLDRPVRPRGSRSVEDWRTLEVVPNRRTPGGTSAGAKQRMTGTAVRDGPSVGRTGQGTGCTAADCAGNSDGAPKATTFYGGHWHKLSKSLVEVRARPNVRAKAGPTVGRQARAGENVQRTAGPGLVARRWASP